jgi:serine/threonine protein kinase/Tfp pilus assembly protein PilF
MRTDPLEPQEDVSLAQQRMILDACAQVGGDSASLPTIISPDGGSRPLTTPGDSCDDIAVDAFPGYRIEQRLHEGGQGVVYCALQLSTQRHVAIKVTRQGPFASVDERARFEREVRILGQLNHPHIVAIHDRGRVVGCDYFVMDLVQGEPLDTFLQQARPGIRETLSLLAQVCDAVNAAHLRGIIHRDLKPGNIMVQQSDEATERSDAGKQSSGSSAYVASSRSLPVTAGRSVACPKILDFGLARLDRSSGGAVQAASLTESGAFVGSVPWASPEQARRDVALDIRTDVYSLGVILFQALTGQMPYSMTGATEEVLSRIIHVEPLRPKALNRRIDTELETILLKCLQKEPERRYQSAGELSREIGRYLAGEPIEAKRDSLAYVLGKYVKRYRARAAAAATVVTAVVAALVISVTFWQIARSEKKTAQTQRDEALRQASLARASTYILFGGIGSAMPASGASGMSAQELLDRFAGRVEEQVTDADPRVEAPVRTLLGAAYRSTGDFRKAHEQLDRALQLWQQSELSDAPEELAKAMDENGQLHQAEHRYVEAEGWLRKALSTYSGITQPQEGLRARFLANLGNCLTSQGRLSEAAACLRESLDVYQGSGSAESRASAAVMDNMGKLAEAAGAMHDAETWLRKAIAIRENVPHGQNTELATSLQNLGVVMLRAGDPAQAATLASSALEIRRKFLRGDHPDVANSLSLLGLALTALDRLDEAERVLRESLEMRTRLYPEGNPAHWNVGQARSALGACLMKRPDRLGEAEDLLLRGYETLAATSRSPRKLLAEAAERLVALYEIRQDADQAQHWRDEVVQHR